MIQLVINGSGDASDKIRQQLAEITPESVLCVEGRVIERSAKTVNPKMATGEIEVELSSVVILNKTHKSLPFQPSNSSEVSGQDDFVCLVAFFSKVLIPLF